ncbi:g9749 [Coccomyxa elongata]
MSAVYAAPQQSNKGSVEQITNFLQSELHQMYSKGVITEDRYALDFSFTDPVVRLQGRTAFAQNLRLLTAIFSIQHSLHSISPGEWDGEVVTRWTFTASLKAVPWQQPLIFTGSSFYTINSAGLLSSQRDVWDAVSDNNYFSIEGVQQIMRMALNPMQTPNLDTPKYTVLKKMADYEIRRYERFTTAEVSMPSESSPASGSGFNDLAGYIFGGNREKERMEMTTPVLTTAGQKSKPGKMAFVMEARMGTDPRRLPVPRDSRVQLAVEGEKVAAALMFTGFPLDYEVIEAERRLRGALLIDGYSPEEGYTLARYNDPFTLPFLRRNEVVITLENFTMD